jgi:hypothetical protein
LEDSSDSKAIAHYIVYRKKPAPIDSRPAEPHKGTGQSLAGRILPFGPVVLAEIESSQPMLEKPENDAPQLAGLVDD